MALLGSTPFSDTSNITIGSNELTFLRRYVWTLGFDKRVLKGNPQSFSWAKIIIVHHFFEETMSKCLVLTGYISIFVKPCSIICPVTMRNVSNPSPFGPNFSNKKLPWNVLRPRIAANARASRIDAVEMTSLRCQVQSWGVSSSSWGYPNSWLVYVREKPIVRNG